MMGDAGGPGRGREVALGCLGMGGERGEACGRGCERESACSGAIDWFDGMPPHSCVRPPWTRCSLTLKHAVPAVVVTAGAGAEAAGAGAVVVAAIAPHDWGGLPV
jgi:hypothetical protein